MPKEEEIEMKIYLAGPLFTVAERNFNTEIAAFLRNAGHKVFLPQDEEEGRSPQDIFQGNLAGLKWANCVVACLDGADPDSGTCWELGYAFAKSKQTLVFRSDNRLYRGPDMVNLMLTEGASTVLFMEEETVMEVARKIEYWVRREFVERGRAKRD